MTVAGNSGYAAQRFLLRSAYWKSRLSELPTVTVPTKAIFLSYASQDTETALQICNALRAAGLEVWFDQSELRGGDLWDAAIRNQVKECTLFVPIISANTDSREEGYFRREWNLAVQRTLDMADDRTFLLPVVIDATCDRDARVPDKFRQVQWTRLPAGAAADAFAERVRALLAGGAAPSTNAASLGSPSLRHPHGARWRWVGAAVCAAGVAAIAVWMTVPRAPILPGPRGGTQITSLAVLPLLNLSGDPSQEYFADGMTDALIAELAHIGALKVISRTSVMQYKRAKQSLPEIARALGVDGIVEGSVQRDGEQVKIAVQLIAAPSDSHLWAQDYVRDLRNVLGLQSQVARAIAEQVRAALTPAETVRLASSKTVDPKAYDLYLRGKALADRPESTLQASELYEQAIARDPDYATAWGALTYSLITAHNAGQTPRTEAFPRAQRAAQRAVELDPGDLDAMKAQVTVAFTIHRDYPAAERIMRLILERAPNDAQTHAWLSQELSLYGRFEESISEGRRAVELDPQSVESNASLAQIYRSARHYDECIEQGRKTVVLGPNFWGYWALAGCFDAVGNHADGAKAQQQWWVLFGEDPGMAAQLVTVQAQRGYRARLRATVEYVLRTSERKSISYWGDLASYCALLGEKDRAFQYLERAYQEYDSWIFELQDPSFDSLRADPRWLSLLQRLHLDQAPMARLPAAPAPATR